MLLGVSVVSNLTLLGFFKYWDFFATNVNAVLVHVGLDLPLPLKTLHQVWKGMSERDKIRMCVARPRQVGHENILRRIGRRYSHLMAKSRRIANGNRLAIVAQPAPSPGDSS